MSIFEKLRVALGWLRPGADLAQAEEPGAEGGPADGGRGEICQEIVNTLKSQRENRIERGFYWENQIAFAYNSNRIEGSRLTEGQTRRLFETRAVAGQGALSDDDLEMENHFELFDYMLDTLDRPLSKELIKEFHAILKRGTDDDLLNESFDVGGWKTMPNAVGNLLQTTPPALVDESIDRLLKAYGGKARKGYGDIAAFHFLFESIHPFQDGNGRCGRMIAFRECIRNDLVPFIVTDESKGRYYEGLRSFDEDPGKLEGYFQDMASLYLGEFETLLPANSLLPGIMPDRANLDIEKYFEERPPSPRDELDALNRAKKSNGGGGPRTRRR